MTEPSRTVLLVGRDEPPQPRRVLRAGPLTAELDGVDLRYVRAGEIEIVRRLFAAIRDEAWGTVPAQLEHVEVEEGERSFRVSFDALHEAGELRFRWRGELTGNEDGTIECRMTGTAEQAFRYCRIGFCVLHPREHAARPYRAETPDGPIQGTLPDTIGMQRIENGKLFPLFPSYRRLELDLEDGVTARFEFEGDLFEMEDQRNWTDASFKTYSTPITLGFPHDVPAGQQFVQSVRLTVERPAADDAAVRLELGETGTFLPSFGLVLGEEPTEREVERLLALRLDHLRVELDLGGDWRAELERAGSTALALGAALELVLRPGDEAQLEELAEALPLAQAKIARVLVLPREGVVSDAEDVRRVREKLGTAAGAATFAAGTDLWFTELNRTRPDLEGVDGVFYSTAATVHADDDTSVLETPAAHGDAVRSARAIAGGRDVHVGPITFRPRTWPFGDLAGYRGLPYQVDQRQPTLIGAAWTVASLKHVAEARATSATYFETTGWRGVLERESGSQAPDVFRSQPGAVFPLYHVLADYGEWRGTTVLVRCRSSRPLSVEALAARTSGGHHLLVANLTPESQRCTIGALESRKVALRTLDETTAAQAVEDPHAFRAAREERPVRDGRIQLELAPYAVVRVDPA